MKKAVILSLSTILAAWPTPPAKAQSTLTLADDPAFGPNSLVVDNSTGFAWLNLTYSAGLSFQQVVADSGPGGEFAGFGSATDQQVQTLFQDAGLSGNGFYAPASPGFQNAQAFVSLIGNISPQAGYPGVVGLTGTSTGSFVDAASVMVQGQSGVQGYSVESPNSTQYNMDYAAGSIGSWLVMPAPEPRTWLLALVGTASLIIGSGKKAPWVMSSKRHSPRVAFSERGRLTFDSGRA